MSNIKNLFFVVSCFLIFFSEANAQYFASNPSTGISVSGDAEVKVVPEYVTFIVGIETIDKDLRSGKAKNDDVIKKILEVMRKNQLPEKDFQTDFATLYPRYYDYQAQRASQTIVDYLYRKTLSIKLTNIGIFDEVMTQLFEAGITHVHDIQFGTSDLKSIGIEPEN